MRAIHIGYIITRIPWTISSSPICFTSFVRIPFLVMTHFYVSPDEAAKNIQITHKTFWRKPMNPYILFTRRTGMRNDKNALFLVAVNTVCWRNFGAERIELLRAHHSLGLSFSEYRVRYIVFVSTMVSRDTVRVLKSVGNVNTRPGIDAPSVIVLIGDKRRCGSVAGREYYTDGVRRQRSGIRMRVCVYVCLCVYHYCCCYGKWQGMVRRGWRGSKFAQMWSVVYVCVCVFKTRCCQNGRFRPPLSPFTTPKHPVTMSSPFHPRFFPTLLDFFFYAIHTCRPLSRPPPLHTQ